MEVVLAMRAGTGAEAADEAIARGDRVDGRRVPHRGLPRDRELLLEQRARR
jgi:hypothetical protein